MPSPKKDKQPTKTKIKLKSTPQILIQAQVKGSPKKGKEPNKAANTMTTNALPRNDEGVRTHLTCELCGYEPTAKNRHQARQDHLMRAHFFSKVEAAFPDMKTRNCPFPDCNFIGKDKQYILRHYVIQHKMNEKWMTEALAERGIKYNPVRIRSRPGERKKQAPRLALVINKPSLVQSYQCEKCLKRFDERCHLILHNRHVHLKYGDDEKKRMDAHRCKVCGKMFVDVKYVQTHMNSVHLKIKDIQCPSCDKKFGTSGALRSHKKKFHPEGGQVTASAPSTTNNTTIPTPSTSQQTAPPTESKQQNKTNFVPAILARASTSSVQTQPSTSNSVSIAV